MLTQEQLIAYYEHQLAPPVREEFERLLANEPEAQMSLADQENIDLALRVLLGKADAHERVKQSIFTVLRGASVAELTAHVMEETGAEQAAETMSKLELGTAPWPRVRRLAALMLERFHASTLQQRLAYAASIAVIVAVALVAWICFRPAPGARMVVGHFAALVGRPTVQHNGKPSTLDPQPSAAIYLGDRIETGDADRAEIQFRDGTTLRLGFNTVLEIPNPQSPIRNLQSTPLLRPPEIALLRGQVWTKVQKLTNGPQYAVRTPVATAVAKGTEFGLKVQRMPTNTNSQSAIRNPHSAIPVEAVLTVKEGAVDFFNSFGSVQATAMTESTARVDARPTEPKRLQTLQVVQLKDSSTLSILTSQLDWPDAAERLALGGGWAGLKVRDFSSAAPSPNTGGVTATNEVRVIQMSRQSPADLAGLTVGDVLIAINGKPVTAANQINRALLLRPGAATTLGLRRAGEERSITVRATNRSSILPGPSLSPAQRARLAELTRRWMEDGVSTSDREIAHLSDAALQAAAQNNLGVVLEAEDATGPAIRAYGRAVYAAPQVPLYHFNLGLALRKIASFERALEELETAARLAPGLMDARKRLAEVHSLQGDDSEALTQTEAALQASPRDHGLWELKAQILSKQGRFGEAHEAARQAVELDPNCPAALAYFAGALQNQGNLVEAESTYRKALQLAPFDSLLHVNLGVLQLARSQLWPAEQSFRKAIELRPDFALAYFNLGNLLAGERDFAQASGAFQKARELDPADASTHLRFGDMALKRRQFELAERAYHDALEVSPRDAETYYGLGEAYRLQRRSADAERAYRKAIELRPDHAAAHTALGIVFNDRGEVNEAERLYRRAIQLNPRESAAYHNLGNLNRDARGDLDAAEKWFRQALERSPDDGESLGGLGLVAAARGNLAEAERLQHRALEREPDSSGINNNLGEVLRQRGRLDEAEPFYKKALELDPDNLAPYGNLGIIQAMRKQFAEAEKTFRALLERSTGNQRLPALVNLASVCSEQGKLDEAERLFRQALALAPNDLQVGNSFASFLADHQRKLDEALTLATRAVQTAPNDPNFLDTLGWVQAQRGELDAAERTLKRALDLAGQEPPAPEIREHLKKLAERTKNSNP